MEILFWKDYFDTLGNAIMRLKEVLTHKDILTNDCLRDASIQRFEFTVELFWKVLKKILIYEKIEGTTPRDVLSKAYQFKLINDEAIWLKMLDDRNKTSHVYKEEDALEVFENLASYLPILENTYSLLKQKYNI